MLALGIIIGLLIALLVITTIIFLRNPIEKHISIIEKRVSSAGPRPKGYIVEPIEEAEEIREQIIEDNRKQGKDTNINELL